MNVETLQAIPPLVVIVVVAVLLFDALVWFAILDGANFDEIRVRSIK